MGIFNRFKNYFVGEELNYENMADQAITVILFLIFLLCPLFFTGLTAQGAVFDKFILFLLLTLAGSVIWIGKNLSNGKIKLRRSFFNKWIIFMILFFVLATIFSVNRWGSFLGNYGNPMKGLVAGLTGVLFFWFLANTINEKRLCLNFYALLISSSVIALAGLLSIFNFSFLNKIIPAGNLNLLGSYANLAAFLLLSLPLLAVGICMLGQISPNIKKSNSLIIKLALAVMIFLFGLTLMILGGFVFWPVSIVSLVVILLFVLPKTTPADKGANMKLFGLLAFIVILMIVGNLKIFTRALPYEINLNLQSSWSIAKDSIKHNPFLGVGPANYYYAFDKYHDNNFNLTEFWNIHPDSTSGLPFELLVTIGLIGSLLFLIIVFKGLQLIYSTLLGSKQNGGQSILLGLFSSLVSLIILVFIFSLNGSLLLYGALIFSLAVAGSMILGEKEPGYFEMTFDKHKPTTASSLALLVLLTAIILIFVGSVNFILADMYFNRSLKSTDIKSAILRNEKAVNLNPYVDVYLLNLSNLYFAQYNNDQTLGQAEKNNLANLAIGLAQKAVSLSPEKAANHEAYAYILEGLATINKDFLVKAEDEYKKISELEPASPLPNLRLGIISANQASAEKDVKQKQSLLSSALQSLDDAISKKANFSPAYFAKAQILSGQGNNDEAIGLLKYAVNYDPNNIDYLNSLGSMLVQQGVASTTQNVVIAKNQYLKDAEQVFLAVLANDNKNINALYGLAIIYQKTGDKANMKIAVDNILKNINDPTTKDSIKKQFGVN